MTETATLDRHQRSGVASKELDGSLAGQVEAVLEEAERSQPADEAETGYWFVRIPQAGVRYYSF